MGLKLTSVVERCLLGPLSMLGPMAGTSSIHTYVASPNSPNREFNPPPAAHLLPPPTPYTCHLWYHSGCENFATVLAS